MGLSTMMNRRQFVCTGAAALFPTFQKLARRPTISLSRANRNVTDRIEPRRGVDDGGKIVAVEADIAGDAPQTIDARGKIVAPGLIDIHTHAGRSKEGPALLLQDGVTGWVDAGSAGADNIDQIATVA